MAEGDFKDMFEDEELSTAPQPVVWNESLEDERPDPAVAADEAARERTEAREAAEAALGRDDAWRERNEQKVRRASLAAGVAVALAVGLAVFSAAQGARYSRLAGALEGQATEIVVASHDLPVGSILKADDLTVAEVAARNAPPDAVATKRDDESRAQAIKSLVGAKTNAPLWANNPVSPSTLQGGASPSDVTVNLAEGTVAMMLSLDPARGVAPLLHVGDRVNVIDAGQESGGEVTVRGARVIALDGSLSGGPDTYSYVTLELTQEQARRLAQTASPWLTAVPMSERLELDAASASK